MARQLTQDDFADAGALYATLTGDTPIADHVQFQQVLQHPGTSVWGAEHADHIVSIATLHLLPNMTYGGRPYGLIENVVTLHSHRGQGFARQVMDAITEFAWDHNAYKLMLLTGTSAGAKGFYQRLGFADDQKFGMVKRRVPPRTKA